MINGPTVEQLQTLIRVCNSKLSEKGHDLARPEGYPKARSAWLAGGSGLKWELFLLGPAETTSSEQVPRRTLSICAINTDQTPGLFWELPLDPGLVDGKFALSLGPGLLSGEFYSRMFRSGCNDPLAIDGTYTALVASLVSGSMDYLDNEDYVNFRRFGNNSPENG